MAEQKTLTRPAKKGKPRTYMGERGYTLYTEDLTTEQLTTLEHDLTFRPNHVEGYGPPPEPFPVFGKAKNGSKIFIPKFYGIRKYGQPDKDKNNKHIQEVKLEFNGELREKQLAPVRACLKAARDQGGGILCLPCGFGKCLGKDTPVMMYDGSIKMVQDIKPGELLMGDDSTPRTVLSTCTGREQMYKVVPKKGDPYIVNESHILSLKCSVDRSKKWRKGTIVDMEVKDYLKLPKSYHGRGGPLLGYRVGVEFPEKKVGFDPYIIGLWLGDGMSRGTGISTQDAVVIQYLVRKLSEYDMYLRYQSQYDYNMCSVPTKNPLMEELRKQDMIMNKHIPTDYKCNSRDIRLKVLAGILDADGHYTHGTFDITQKNETLLDDIIYLARSLGFAAYKKKCEKSCMYKGKKRTGTYYRTKIHGEGLQNIPTLIARKRAEPRKQIKDALVTRIHLEKLEVDDYYGFEIDGNRRFLLGDFTVTHNTCLGLYLVHKLGVKTLIVVAKEFLMEQWEERISQFLPTARVGILRQKKQEIENKDIVIGMLQSISMCDYSLSIYKSFGMVIYDEVHCVPSRVFSKALRRVQTKYHFGLSATPNRPDGMTKVTKMFIGPIVYRINKRKAKKNPKNTQVIRLQFKTLPSNGCYRERRNYRGKPDTVKMISKLIECPKRVALIAAAIRFFIVEDKRHILVLSERIQYLRDIHKQLQHDVGSTDPGDLPFRIGYYIGETTSKERKVSATCDLILATYAMAKEAMDIPILDTLVLATSKGNAGTVEQCVGRVQRKPEYPEDRPPLVVDIVDDFASFSSQAWRRRDYFRKAHYPIQEVCFDEKTDVLQDMLEACVENFVTPDEVDADLESITKDESVATNDTGDKVPDLLAPPEMQVDDHVMDMILAGATGGTFPI